MCYLQYHNCPECGEEMKCYQRDRDCVYLQGMSYPCEKCDHWIEEIHESDWRDRNTDPEDYEW